MFPYVGVIYNDIGILLVGFVISLCLPMYVIIRLSALTVAVDLSRSPGEKRAHNHFWRP